MFPQGFEALFSCHEALFSCHFFSFSFRLGIYTDLSSTSLTFFSTICCSANLVKLFQMWYFSVLEFSFVSLIELLCLCQDLPIFLFKHIFLYLIEHSYHCFTVVVIWEFQPVDHLGIGSIDCFFPWELATFFWFLYVESFGNISCASWVLCCGHWILLHSSKEPEWFCFTRPLTWWDSHFRLPLSYRWFLPSGLSRRLLWLQG